jgi:integrase
MTTPTPRRTAGDSRSVFAGTDVCREAGLALPTEARRPMFEDDLWDFTTVIGLPTQMAIALRRFDFTTIVNTRWRLVAKELILALLAPRHEAVAPLPRAYRTPLHLNSANGRRAELARWLNWLTQHGYHSLSEVDDGCCEAYLAHRRHIRDDDGARVGERSPATRRAATQVVVDLINYRELFSTDRVPADLRPWGGATPSAIAEMKSGREENKTPPVPDSLLQPMMAAALYLVTVIGPHAVDLAQQVRDADRQRRPRGRHPDGPRPARRQITEVLAEYKQAGQPLPLLPEHHIRDRVTAGWHAKDPLTPLSLDVLARQAGFRQFDPNWTPHLRPAIEKTLAAVGAQKQFGRNAPSVDRADGQNLLAWTLPLHRLQAVALVGVVRTAAITVTAAVSGMRSSELMELKVGCRRPPETYGPDLVRYRLASKVVKRQPLGGVDDEWVVIEPVYRAVELAEALHDDPREGAPLFGRFAFEVRHRWLRDWVNGPAGQRLGLAAIPDSPVNLRMLRRTLAIELAYRPGGLLAAKFHLRHISVATTDGYASRPGGAQAEMLAEVNKHETERNLDLVWAEFRNYQQGILPAGPGARELTDFFAHIDGKLALLDTDAPRVQRNDREVLNLLSKRANTLNLGTANYCWFTDPSRALCLKLAGTPHADKPLAGMCDSARCSQATHHPHHRPVWADHAERTATFLGNLGPTRKTEKARLQADHDRALRVLADIDKAAADTSPME